MREAAADPELYDYRLYKDRLSLVWQGGKTVAVWLSPNLEFYEIDPPANPHQSLDQTASGCLCSVVTREPITVDQADIPAPGYRSAEVRNVRFEVRRAWGQVAFEGLRC